MEEIYMRQALQIASFAEGRTSPNPLVGAVIVKDGRIAGQGWHRQAGTPHAEIHAIQQAGELSRGSELYVTLEPCSHYGRTGPCTEAIIDAGIRRVIVAMTDPNPIVAGRGIHRLRSAGIEVTEGVLAELAAKQNEIFIKWISTGLPFGILKTATTLDGKIATSTGESQWITGEEARGYVHKLRDTCDVVFTGIGTVLADNPQLTTRLPLCGRNPVRVIADSSARIPLNSNVLQDGQSRTIIAVTPLAPADKIRQIRERGVEVLVVEEKGGRLDLRSLFKQLGEQRLSSILVEGGTSIAAAVLEANLIDRIHWFIAPKIVGGTDAPGPVGGLGITRLSDAMMLEDRQIDTLGNDIMITAYLTGREGRDVYRTCGRIGQG